MKDRRWILAIDPGARGGLVCRWKAPGRPVKALKMPDGERAIAHEISSLSWEPGLQAIYIEKVWGRESDSKRSITTFMRHTGFLVGCLYSSIILPGPDEPRLVEVLPKEWQEALGCPKAPSRKEEPKAHRRKTIHKNHLKDMAQELHPDLKVTLMTADALLIAEYAVREEGW
jgi:hypothetical protein